MILSKTLPIYKEWLLNATAENIERVDRTYLFAEENYHNGADQIVECFSPEDILAANWQDEADIREVIQLHREAGLNARWGEDSDCELA
jgi:hypothetical protein